MTAGGERAPSRVVALGLDSAEWALIETHAAAGALPNIATLLRRGSRALLDGPAHPELAWAEILSGCPGKITGYASPLAFSPADYTIVNHGAHDFAEIRPFYGYCRGRRIIVFDPPQSRLAPEAEGVQVLGWGSHSQLGPSLSAPAALLPALEREFGPHPAFTADWMTVPEGAGKGERLLAAFLAGIARRTEICLALMRREPWDLVFLVFGETHAGGHALWHLGATDHPLAARRLTGAADAMLAIHRAIDVAIGRILAAAGPDARVVLFSSHGMTANASELGSLVFLPELLFRDCFGVAALAAEPAAEAGDWGRLLWATQRDPSPLRRVARRRLPLGLSRRFERAARPFLAAGAGLEHPYTSALHYMPPLWYRPYWPLMPAFALPSFSDGFIRFNLRGRESRGIVGAADVAALSDRLTRLLRGLSDARTGKPAVREVAPASAVSSGLADLVVAWSETPIDAVVSSGHGRIGPLPYRQAGGHTARGFICVGGNGTAARELPPGRLVDIAPTILDLMEVARPNHLDGVSLLASRQ